MIGTLKHQTKVALQFAMVRGKENVRLIDQMICREPGDNPADRIVNEFVFNVGIGVDLTDLIRRQVCRHKIPGRLKITPDCTFIITAPVLWLLVEQREARRVGLAIQPRQWHVSPIVAMQFAAWNIPRMVGVWKAHPTKEGVLSKA